MRLLRLSLAAAVALATVAAPASGQTDSDTYVTGTLGCGLAGDVSLMDDESVTLERFPGRCVAEFNDPRITGTADSDITEVCFKEAGWKCMLWGAVELKGPDGIWVGSWTAVSDETGGLPTWLVAEGTGAYEGWTLVTFTPNQMLPEASTFGFLYEGPPPPWGETLPLTSAD
jgi:hypothetical protein